MFNSPFTNTKSAGFYRQSSRQTLLFRSAPKLNIGKWHLKTVILTLCVLLLLFLYAQKVDFHSDSKQKKRELVVRAAKPYKSPFHRRRYTKQPKGAKGSLLFNSNGNMKNDTKLNKTKSALLQKQRPNQPVSNKNFQQKEKHIILSNSKPRQTSASWFHLNTYDKLGALKTPHIKKPDVEVHEKHDEQMHENTMKAGSSDTKVSGQQANKNFHHKNTGTQQWSQKSEQTGHLNVPAAVLRSKNKNVNPTFKVELPGDFKIKGVPFGDLSKKVIPPENFKSKIVPPMDFSNKIVPPGDLKGEIVLPSDFSNQIVPPGVFSKSILPLGDYNSKILPAGDVRNKIISAGEENNKIIPAGDKNNKIIPVRNENNKIIPAGDVNIKIEPPGELKSNILAPENDVKNKFPEDKTKAIPKDKNVKSEPRLPVDVNSNSLPKHLVSVEQGVRDERAPVS